MLGRLGSAVVFVAGSVVGGLALAFLIVALRPDLIRNVSRASPGSQPAVAQPPAPAPARVSYADAVQRAAPAVVNIYTRRLVTERLAPSLGELFGEYMPRYRQRIERSLGSGVIVDAEGHIVTNHHVIANADSIRVQLEDGRVAACAAFRRPHPGDHVPVRGWRVGLAGADGPAVPARLAQESGRCCLLEYPERQRPRIDRNRQLQRIHCAPFIPSR